MTSTESAPRVGASTPSATLAQRTARALLHKRLSGIRSGHLVLREGDDQREFGSRAAGFGSVQLTVRDPGFHPAVVLRGAIGAAESYMDGRWIADDLVALVRLLVRDRDVLARVDGGLARLTTPARRLWHSLRRNSLKGSRYNIAAHYDLGNELFAQFLDESLTYSCGIFEGKDTTLAEAQTAKLDLLCSKLELGPEDHLLEIGTGWGSMALHAASSTGCRVTTTTISEEQFELARQRVADAGLQDRVEVLLEDYRELRGQYDKIVSVEMIEAVGHRFVDTYFRRCRRLLKPGGTMALQAITIADQQYRSALRRVDFIKRYIFPGSFIPSVSAIVDSAARVAGFRVQHLEDFGPHYARTLRVWRENLLARRSQIGDLGYSDEFVRMFEFYLAYCEGGYAERYLGLAQVILR